MGVAIRWFGVVAGFGVVASLLVVAAPLSPTTAAATPCFGGLVHHWRFDEGSGAAAADSEADSVGAYGTVTGAGWTTGGQVGGALGFDGDGDYVQLGAESLPAGGCGWTAALWVNRSADSDFSALFSQAGDSGAQVRLEQWEANNKASNKVGITRFGDGDWSWDHSTTRGTWEHLVFVGTSSQTELYVNGVSKGSISQSINLPLHTIGAHSNGKDSVFAVLDDVRVYAKALSATEVAALYAAATVRPSRPQEVAVSLGDGTLTVAWEAPASDGGAAVSGYSVQHKAATPSRFYNLLSPWETVDLAASARSHTISGLVNGTAYSVRVRAANLVGNSEWSQPISAVPVCSGLVHHWRFDETAGAVAADSVGGRIERKKR